MNNKEVAKVFQDIADLLELKGENIFKIRVYQKVARSVKHLLVEMEQLVAEDKLKEVPGVGVARRGWCQAQDILNTRPSSEIITYLGS